MYYVSCDKYLKNSTPQKTPYKKFQLMKYHNYLST